MCDDGSMVTRNGPGRAERDDLTPFSICGESGGGVPDPHPGEGCADTAESSCRLGAVCRLQCRDMQLCAAICRVLVRKYWRLLGLFVSSQAEGRGREPASPAKRL
jgi:hypothetical protein